MHELTNRQFHLSQLHPLTKMLLSFFAISMLAALFMAAVKYTDRASWTPRGVTEFVAGSADVSDDPFGDPLGGTPEGRAVREGKSRRELVDIVHPHLFTVPIVLFILGHLLLFTGLRDRWKFTINIVAFGSFLATFLLPFGLRESPTLAPVMLITGSLLMISFVLLCLVPLGSMWWGKPRARAGDRTAAARQRREPR